MIIVLWILQILLALLFLTSGYSKTFQYNKKEAELKKMDHLESKGLIMFIGTAEMLGALGLILPKATDIHSTRINNVGSHWFNDHYVRCFFHTSKV